MRPATRRPVALVAAMAELAVEELTHYREVVKWIHRRGLLTAADRKDHYVLALRDAIRSGSEAYLLDRLLTASIIEARGAERFALVAAALPAAVPTATASVGDTSKAMTANMATAMPRKIAGNTWPPLNPQPRQIA